MSSEMNRLPAELAKVERMLGGLTPAASGLDRDRLMFEAGRTAAVRAGRLERGRERMWQGACAVLVLVCGGLALGWRGSVGRSAAPVVAQKDVAAPSVAEAPGETGAGGGGGAAAHVAVPVASGRGGTGSVEDDWRSISLPGLPADALEQALSGGGAVGGGSGGNGNGASLKKGDGLEALPAWQRRMMLKGSGL